jgi:hypothetical protein
MADAPLSTARTSTVLLAARVVVRVCHPRRVCGAGWLPLGHTPHGRRLAVTRCVWQPAAMGMGRTSRGAALVTAALLAGGVCAAAVLGALASPGYAAASDSTLLFHFADTQIDESSGLGTSSYGDGIVYTHNDSGDTARFFAVNSSGATVGIYTLKGATARDWEDMETGTDASGKPVLYFGDIGDNSSKRTEIDVYQVPEPRGPSADVPWIRYRFKYPDGSHNAETLMVDPHTHRIFVASKAGLGQGTGLLYEAPAVLSTTAINTLALVEPLRVIPNLTTSGDISPDGKLMVLLTYFAAYWSVGVNGTLHEFPVTEQRQDEGVAFTRDGKSILIDSEGVHSAVYRIALPADAIAADVAAGGTSAPRPTTKPVPTAKPTVKPTATTKPTAIAPTPTTQAPASVTTSLPASSALSSFESPAPAPASSALVSSITAPSEAASSGGRQLQAGTTLTSVNEGRGWLLWVAVPFVICVIVVLLVLARRFRWWPWGPDGFKPGRRR